MFIVTHPSNNLRRVTTYVYVTKQICQEIKVKVCHEDSEIVDKEQLASITYKVTVPKLDVKPVFWSNLALQKWKNQIFGQIWIYLIWPSMSGDSHCTHHQYLISCFSGQFTQLKKFFQPGVLYYISKLATHNLYYCRIFLIQLLSTNGSKVHLNFT